ncbi:alpha/beta fold hydrolase [Actinoplanes sp. NPDC049118]|uniref:alpha/beta fold hydrolase n=1 Tax=Actinoplanes sp. NPDC049118 TaxID=3155769 RepID=UPI0033EB81ED
MIFVPGRPELGLVWRAQVEHFTAADRRCVAPDLRGYGTAPAPARAACADLSEATIDAGHEVMLQAPAQTNAAIAARRPAP